MAENSKIEWTDHTFNPWIGCQAVSPGCDNCYAAEWANRYGRDFAARTRTTVANWRKPLAWNAAHVKFYATHGRRQRVFCASLADVFDNAVDPQWREDLFQLIAATPNLDWLLLTKRIGNASRMLPVDWSDGYPNVWLGISVVNQEEAIREVRKLHDTPARVRFLSMEPLLGRTELDYEWLLSERFEHSDDCRNDLCALNGDAYSCLGQVVEQPRVDWVIAGGESGPHARPVHPEWLRKVRDDCEATGVPFFFKQWGEFLPAKLVGCTSQVDGELVGGKYEFADQTAELRVGGPVPLDRPVEYLDSTHRAFRLGKRRAGRLLDGRQHDEYPIMSTHGGEQHAD